ncbi:MAG TPA: hypothetical protein VF280_00450 [Burkholderiales bacterium]
MKNILILAVAALAAGCAGGPALVAGQSTLSDVERSMGHAADKRIVGSETVYYYPQLPWGYASYAARISPDGRLVALEQRLTEDNIKKIKVDVTRGGEVLDLLGPPYEPMKQARTGSEIWTYPMRIAGHPTPKWFLVTVGPGGVVTEAYLIDDPNWDRRDSGAFPG